MSNIIEIGKYIIRFDTIEFIEILSNKNDLQTIINNHELNLKLFTFIIQSLFQQKEDKEYFSNSSESALNYLLNLNYPISTIDLFLCHSNNYYKIFTYIRSFLSGYKINSDKKYIRQHKVLIVFLKLMIKFMNIEKFYHELVSNIVIKISIELLKQVKDNLEMVGSEENLLEIFDYLIVFMFRFSVKSSIYLFEESFSLIKISESIINSFTVNKCKYSYLSIFYSFLSICNCLVDFRLFRYFQSKINRQLLQIGQKFIVGIFEKENYKIIYNDTAIEDFEYNKFINLFEIILSLKRFTYAIFLHDLCLLEFIDKEIENKIQDIFNKNFDELKDDKTLFDFYKNFERRIQIDFDLEKDSKKPENKTEDNTMMIKKERSITNEESIYYYLENINNDRQAFKDFIKELLIGLNENCFKIEIFYQENDYLDKIVWLYESYKDDIKINELLEFLLLKIYLRKNTKNLDKSKRLYFEVSGLVKKSENYLVTGYFLKKFDENLIKQLVKSIHFKLSNIEEDKLFNLNSFEIYEYLVFLLDSNLSDDLIKFLNTEFYDKKCFDLIMNDLEYKYGLFKKGEKKIEFLYDFKTTFKLALAWITKYDLIEDENSKRLRNFLATFELPESSSLSFETILDNLKECIQPKVSKTLKKKNKILETKGDALQILEETLVRFKNLINDIEKNYKEITNCFSHVLVNYKYLNEESVVKIMKSGINKDLFYLIKFYFENLKITKFKILLTQILCLLEIFTDFKFYDIYSDKSDYNLDVLDLLIDYIIINDGFYGLTNLQFQLFTHLLYKLTKCENKIEIIRVKFKKFNLYYDFLKNIKLYKNYDCLNSILMLISNLIYESNYKELFSHAITYLKDYTNLFFYSIYEAIYVTKKIQINGKFEYILLPQRIDYIETSCDLSLAITNLAKTIELSKLPRRYLCSICLDDTDYLNMFFLLIQKSFDDYERLAGLHMLWLLLGITDQRIVTKVKSELSLILKQWNSNHSCFEIRSFSGSILWLISDKRTINDKNECYANNELNLKYSVQESSFY